MANTTATPTHVVSASSTASSVPAHAGQSIVFRLGTDASVSLDASSGTPFLTLDDGDVATFDAADTTATSPAFASVVGAGRSDADLRIAGYAGNGSRLTASDGTAVDTSGVSSLPGADTGIRVSATSPDIVLGSGNASIVLLASEDAWMGDATFTVAVDGVRLGGTQMSSSLHSAGAPQRFLLDGNWTTGSHVVSVDYLNDAYDGTPATDRNLWIEGVETNAQSNPGGEMLSSGTAYFDVTTVGAPTTPVLMTQQGDLRETVAQAFRFSLPAASYSDPSGGTISYSASTLDGSPLPSWVSFDPADGTFSGTTPDFTSDLGIKVVATTQEGAQAAEGFHIYATAPLPVLQVQAGDQRLQPGEQFSFGLKDSSFTDPAGGTVSLTALGVDGRALPDWISFHPGQNVFDGTVPSGNTAFGVMVVASTSEGAASAEAFHVYAAPSAPQLAAQAPDERIGSGKAFSFSLPAPSYADPAGGPVSLSVATTDLTPLPSWISFDARSDAFSGTTPVGSGVLGIRVDASTSSGGTAAEAFHIYFGKF